MSTISPAQPRSDRAATRAHHVARETAVRSRRTGQAIAAGEAEAELSGPTDDFTVEQLHVENAINLMGGYWPPEAAVMRLLEELSELASAMTDSIGNVGEELADITIISTCLANQFRIGLGDPGWTEHDHNDHHQGHQAHQGYAAFVRVELADLVRHSGRIARVINCYAGPKKPKPAEQLEHLGKPIIDLHRDLHRLAESLDIDLRREVATKLRHTLERDHNRFAKSFDPAGADVLASFDHTVNTTACRFARTAKLWGGPTWRSGRSVSYNCEATVPYLTRFARAAVAEGLDGFVISPAGRGKAKSVTDVGRQLRETVRTLIALDPDRVAGGPSGQHEIVAEPGWQFTFASQRLFITVFSDVYPVDHVRYSANGTFIVFQPEESFSAHGIGRAFKDSERIKESVRANFDRNGQSYPRDLIDTRIEAYLYLLPVDTEDPVHWWEPDHDPAQGSLF